MSRAKVGTCWPSTVHCAAGRERFSNSHASWTSPRMVRRTSRSSGHDVRIAAGRLLRSILPGIEHVEVDQVPELQPAIERQRRTRGDGRGAQRHGLVVRLIGGGAAQQEDLRRRVALVAIAGIVVVDLVIVPGHDERRRQMRRHQIRIRFVLRVAVAIVDQRVDFLSQVLADVSGIAMGVAAAFVDVIAGVEHEVELFLGQPAVAGEVAGFEMPAPAHAKAQAIHCRAGRWRGDGATNLTGLAATTEAIEVFPSRREALGLDVHAVAKLRPRDCGARADDVPERAVGGDLPRHFDVGHRHAAAIEGLGSQPGPQHDALRPGIARRHAEGKRILLEHRLRPRQARGHRQRRRGAEFPADVEELTSRHGREQLTIRMGHVDRHESLLVRSTVVSDCDTAATAP